MAGNVALKVVGIDLSTNMIAMANRVTREKVEVAFFADRGEVLKDPFTAGWAKLSRARLAAQLSLQVGIFPSPLRRRLNDCLSIFPMGKRGNWVSMLQHLGTL